MRYLTLLLAVFLVGCGSDSSTAPIPPADTFWSQPGPAVRVTVLAGTKEAPAKVGRVRVEAIWDTTDGDTLQIVYQDSVLRISGDSVEFKREWFSGYKATGWKMRKRKSISAEFNVYGNDSSFVIIHCGKDECKINDKPLKNSGVPFTQFIYFQKEGSK